MEELLQDENVSRSDLCTVCNTAVAMHKRSPVVHVPDATPSSNVVQTLSKLDLPKWTNKSVANTHVKRIEQLLCLTTLSTTDYPKTLMISMNDINQAEWVKINIIDKNLDWANAKQKFISHFARADFSIQLAKEFRELRQLKNQSAQEYADKFQSLASQLGYSDDSDSRSLDQYVQGLSNELYKSYQQTIAPMLVKGETIDTLSEAIQMSIALDVASANASARGDFTFQRFQTSAQKSQSKPNVSLHCDFHPASSTHSTSECRMNNTKKTETSTIKKEISPTVSCYQCGQNHYKSQCPNNVSNTANQNSTKPEPRRSERIAKQPESFKPTAKAAHVKNNAQNDRGISSSTRPPPVAGMDDSTKSIFFVLGGTAYKVLLDTGADTSFMDHALVKQLELNINVQPGTIRLAQKDHFSTRIGKTDSLSLCILFAASNFPAYETNQVFEIMDLDTKEYSFILGCDLLHEIFPTSIPMEFIKKTRMVKEQNVHAARVDTFGDIPPDVKPNQVELSTEDHLKHEYDCQRSIIQAHTDSLLAINESIEGFCTLPESEVYLDVDPATTKTLFIKQYNIAESLRSEVTKIVERWFNTGKIELAEPGTSFNNPITCAPKKDDQGNLNAVRVCLDTRQLNMALLTQDRFQLPYIRDAIEQFANCKIFGEFDLQEAYLQFKLHPDSRKYTAFTWNGRQYQFVGCPFGIACLPSVFQRVMSHTFSNLLFTFPYLDNLPFASKDWSSHEAHAKAIISRLNDVNLKIKPSSVKLGQSRIAILGHVISSQGVSVHPDKVKQIESWPLPSTGKQLQSFLGFVTFIRSHIRHISDLSAGLESIKNHKAIDWNDVLRNDFEIIKQAVANAPFLKLPDFNQRFAIATDASNSGVGGVLYQPKPNDNNEIKSDNIVMICSKILNQSQTHYSTYKKELFAIVYCLRKFHSYVYGRQFDLYTDHKPLTFIFTSEKLSVPLQQWLDVIISYSFRIRHREGILNVVPDMLSRMYASAYKRSTWGVPKHIIPDPTFDSQSISAQAISTRSRTQLKGGGKHSNDKMKSDIAIQCFLRDKISPPDNEKIALIQHHHALGHFGRDALFKKLWSINKWWPGMREDIEKVVQSCDACCRFSVQALGYHPAQFIQADGPWTHIQVDCSVHLPESEDGHKVLLVVIDIFTGFVILKPLITNTAEIIANELWSIFAIMGLPKILQTDNGPEFSNKVVKALTSLIGIQHRFITPYNPRCDGKVERVIGTIMSIIKKLLNGTTKYWPLFVSFAQFSYNQKLTSLTGSSPFCLMFARQANDITDYSQIPIKTVNLNDWKAHQEKVLSLILPAISSRIQLNKSKMVKSLDAHRKQLLQDGVPAGTSVMIIDEKRENKFEPKFVGPYTIIRRARNGAYVLRDAAGDLLDRHVTVDKMKILKRLNIGKDDVYEVERITEHRGVAGNYEYLTSWKGFSEKTWEPQANFLDDRPIKSYWKTK